MKILYISYDGAKEPIPQSQVLPYLRQFTANGEEIFWLSFDKKNSFQSKKEKTDFKKELKGKKITWFSLDYHKKPALLAKVYDIIHGFFYALLIILKEKIEIIHGRSEVASIIALFLKKILRINFIYDRRGFIAEDYVEGGMWKNRESLVYKLSLYVDKKLLAESAWVVVLTKKIRDILTQTYPHLKNKISVIPCCVDLKKFTPREKGGTKTIRGETISNHPAMAADGGRKEENSPAGITVKENTVLSQPQEKDKFAFLYSGSIGTWYMIDEMLDFFKLAKDKIPEARFCIFSLGDLNIVRGKADKRQIKKSDLILEGVSPDKINKYVSLGDAALIFIKPVFSKLASSPTKFAEALACGMPVIINSGIGDTEEVITSERIGIVVKKFSEESYRNAIEELLELLKEKETLRKRCRDAAIKHFSLEYGSKEYLKIYKNISLNPNRALVMDENQGV